MFYRDWARETGAGSNPAVWFVAVASALVAIQFWIVKRKEAYMTDTNAYRKTGRRKAQVKSKAAKFTDAVATTIWAIATNWAAGLVTLPLHAKGAPQCG